MAKRAVRKQKQNRRRKTVRSRRTNNIGLPGMIGTVIPFIGYRSTESVDLTATSGQIALSTLMGLPTRIAIYAVPPRDTKTGRDDDLATVIFTPRAAFLDSTTFYFEDVRVSLPYNSKTKLIYKVNFTQWFRNGLSFATQTVGQGRYYDIGDLKLVGDNSDTWSGGSISIFLVIDYEERKPISNYSGLITDPTTIVQSTLSDVNVQRAKSSNVTNIVGQRMLAQHNRLTAASPPAVSA